MSIFRKMIVFLLSFVLLITLTIIVVVFGSKTVWHFTQNQQINAFKLNKSIYISSASKICEQTKNMLFSTSYYEVLIEQTSELMYKCNVASVSVEDGNIFYEQKSRVLWMFPHGIVYVQNMKMIPEWRKLIHIEGNWFYYHDAS